MEFSFQANNSKLKHLQKSKWEEIFNKTLEQMLDAGY